MGKLRAAGAALTPSLKSQRDLLSPARVEGKAQKCTEVPLPVYKCTVFSPKTLAKTVLSGSHRAVGAFLGVLGVYKLRLHYIHTSQDDKITSDFTNYGFIITRRRQDDST